MIRVGLIGGGIQKSLSPALHEAEGAAQGLDYSYQLFDLDGMAADAVLLPTLLERLRRDGYAGSNVTHPVKQAIIPYLDSLSDEAAAIGAVNTLRIGADGRFEGHNTDWWGFGENLRRGLAGTAIGEVVLLGGGGAGAAAAYALGRLGASRIMIADVDTGRAGSLASLLHSQGFPAVAITIEEVETCLASADGLVQATPVGMVRYPGLPVDPAWLRPEIWVAEIVYVPLVTQLLAAARDRGCRTIDGGGMVVLQAARAFEVFTGRDADIDRMFAHFARLSAAAA